MSSLIMWIGSVMNSSAASSTSSGKVALNNNVCSREEDFSRIHNTSGKKPISSILSASSKQKIEIRSKPR